MKKTTLLLTLVLVLIWILFAYAIRSFGTPISDGERVDTLIELAPVAFPGAEGFGANTIGGRGGTVYIVTNTNDSGTGSLRACVQATGARTCVFETGGLIALNSPLVISNPDITICLP